jgi:glycosyltransferase involved in cell wall biosynthesis
MVNSLVSIIVRTKDEEAWIGICLDAIKKQTYQNIEVIVVDTGSTDSTLDILKNYDIKLVIYDEKYIPGKALNYGCRVAKGEYLAFISAHCLPVDEFWLENLVKDISDPHIAGIYGKQEPMDDTNPFDKRDLILTFGLDRKVQWKEHFFHNANSVIKAKLWKQLPFDESLSNIEDRIWAANMQKLGYCIVYEPSARVFHHHGIHQTGNPERCHGVNKIIDNLEKYVDANSILTSEIKKEFIDAVIPFSNKLDMKLDREQIKNNLSQSIKLLKSTDSIRDIYLLTDSELLIEYINKNYTDVKIPYIRKNDDNETVLGILEDLVEKVNFVDSTSFLIAYINDFKNTNSYKYLLKEYNNSDKSSAVIAKENKGMFFKKSQDLFYRLDEQLGRYKGYKSPIYEVIEEKGYIVHISNIKDGFLHKQDTLVLEHSDE